MAVWFSRVRDDGLEECPADGAVVGVAGETVEDEDGFDGFGAEVVFGVADCVVAGREVG